MKRIVLIYGLLSLSLSLPKEFLFLFEFEVLIFEDWRKCLLCSKKYTSMGISIVCLSVYILFFFGLGEYDCIFILISGLVFY
jgi:hypothetical protein